MAVPPACKLVSLEIAGFSHDPLDWSQIVACPAIQQLRSLRLTGLIEMDADHVRALAALPRLTELWVDGAVAAPAEFAAFSASPSLTSLESCDTRNVGFSQGAGLKEVLLCPTLVRLSVLEPAPLFVDGCSSLCALPGMERIRDLTLSAMDAGDGHSQAEPAPPEVSSASPAALVALQSLTIRHLCEIDKFLPYLRLAPVLCSLTIEPPRYDPTAIPSPAVREAAVRWARSRLTTRNSRCFGRIVPTSQPLTSHSNMAASAPSVFISASPAPRSLRPVTACGRSSDGSICAILPSRIGLPWSSCTMGGSAYG